MATCTTFSYNGGPPKTLNATIVTAQLLGKLFQLDPASICLLDDAGGFYENGDIKHLSNEKKYDVNGNSLSAMSPAPVGQQANNGVVTFTRDETKNLENSVIQRTGDMFVHLEGVAKAPSAVQKIQMLSILAACASDLSLVNDTTADRIELLTMPKSFKASLVQVVNEATEAFLKADIGMTRIKMNLATIPQTLVTSIEVAADPDDPAGAKILERNREKIDQVAKSCSAECKDVADKFSKVMALIDELIEVGTATQGVNEEQMKKLESIKREYEERQKHLAQQQKKMEHDIEKQKEETKLALDDYKEKAAQMGDLGNVFAACMTDTLNSVVRGAVRLVENTVESAKDLAKNVSHQVVNIGTDDKTPKFAHNKAKGYEAGLLNFVENHYSDQLPPLEELKKNAEQTIYCFEQFLKVKAASPEGQFLQKACKEYTKLLQDVAHMPSVYPNLVAQFDVIQIAAQTARKKLEEERAREAEKLKAAAGIMEQMNTSASQSQTNYQNMRKREDELENKVWKVREELSELISKLANTAEEKLDLTDIIEYLAKGLTELGNLKESWVQQQLFFASIADTVSKPMAETLKSFMDQQKDLTDTPSSKRLKKCLIQTAMEACAICLQIRQCATIYHEVSQTYVIPGITNVTQNLQLTKSEAKNKFITMQNKSDELERKVLSLIKERKGQMLTDTVGQITNYTGQLAITDN